MGEIWKNNNVPYSRIMSASKLVFGGIDYSLIKLVGQDFNDPNHIVHYMFGAWNELFISEPNKYNIFSAIKRAGLVDLHIVEKNNGSVDPGTIRTSIIPVVQRQELQNLAKSYDFDSQEGYVMVLIPEYYCKPYQNASYWVVFICAKTKNVVWAKPLKVPCKGGFGFKNYWASTIFGVIQEIGKRQKTWKKR